MASAPPESIFTSILVGEHSSLSLCWHAFLLFIYLFNIDRSVSLWWWYIGLYAICNVAVTDGPLKMIVPPDELLGADTLFFRSLFSWHTAHCREQAKTHIFTIALKCLCGDQGEFVGLVSSFQNIIDISLSHFDFCSILSLRQTVRTLSHSRIHSLRFFFQRRTAYYVITFNSVRFPSKRLLTVYSSVSYFLFVI